MNNFLSSIKDSLPAITRQVVSMPFMEWVTALLKNKGTSIPVYTSVKSEENPNGFKFSSVREMLEKPQLIASEEIRIAVQGINKGLLYTLGKNKAGHKEMYIFYEELREAMTAKGFRVNPIAQALRKATTKKATTEPTKEKPSKPSKLKK